MKDASVTVGVSCYNARDTIVRALKSAMAQDWHELEIVVVDDHSTDGSTEIIRELIALDARARLIEHRQNLGVGATRNTILAHAHGEFVTFFDDDDESLPNRVRAQVHTLIAHEAATRALLVACYAGGERLYPNGYRLDSPAVGMRGPVPAGPAMAEYLLTFKRRPDWFYGAGTPACALLARRTTFEAIGWFDPALRRLEDADFAVRLALRGGHFVGTPERLYIRHMTGGTEKSNKAIFDAHVALVEKHRKYLCSIGRYNYALRWPRLRYWHFERRYGLFVLELLLLLLYNPVAVTRHLLETGPARLIHERKIQRTRRRETACSDLNS